MHRLTGIHHVSALTNDIRGTHAFYTRVMGMRLVKKTVNQDDPSMYHLLYADALGSPGSEMTYFDMPLAKRERRGNNSISRTTFRVDGEASLRFWAKRFAEHGVAHGGLVTKGGRLHLDFEDPAGLAASLVDDGGRGEAHPWDGSPVPARHQLRGLGYSEITVPELQPTHDFLTGVLNMVAERSYLHPDAEQDAPNDTPGDDDAPGGTAGDTVHVYRMDGEGPDAEIHVAVRPDLARARYGSGGVHHVALRVPDERFDWWTERLEGTDLQFSGAVDRFYFRSMYVREPGGVMFELATDGPGFLVDESDEDLGKALSLPPFLEARRAEIEARLEPID